LGELRGVFYAIWNPTTSSRRYDADTFTGRFAQDTSIPAHDVATAAPRATAALLQHLSADLLEKARLLLLPDGIGSLGGHKSQSN